MITIFVPVVISAAVSAERVRYCNELAAAKSVMVFTSASLGFDPAGTQISSLGAVVGVGGTAVAAGVAVGAGVWLAAAHPAKRDASSRLDMIKRNAFCFREDMD